MIGIVYDDNGTKKIKPLAGSSGSGLPLGTILPLYTSSIPTGYLPCDGSTFDASEFPALYGLLGTNVLPDLREVALKGIGLNHNATNHVSSTGLSVGEYLEDRFQNHSHYLSLQYGGGTAANVFFRSDGNTSSCTGNVRTGRTGATTEVKAVGVNYVIKAVSGITEADKDYVAAAVANEIKDGDAYSTTEIKTNKTWIDGKPIYRKVISHGALPSSASTILISHGITNIDYVIHAEAIFKRPSDNGYFNIPYVYAGNSSLEMGIYVFGPNSGSTSNSIIISVGTDRSDFTSGYITIEYTKTTD